MKRKILIGLAVSVSIPFIIYFAFPEIIYYTFIKMERSAANLEKKEIQLSEHKIVYLEGGKGDTVLLIHGYSANKDNWNKISKFLTKKYHVIQIDLPGHGESSQDLSKSYAIQKQITTLNEFAEKLNLKKAHIAGNSMGGSIAAAFSIKYPEKVKSLGLFNSAGIYSGKKSELELMLQRGENPFKATGPDYIEKLMKFAFVKPPVIPDFVKKILYKISVKNEKINHKIMLDLQANSWDLEPELKKIKAKTLIIWGDQDRLIDISKGHIFNRKIPDSSMVILKNCGHIPMIERPEETADYYLKFLKTIKN